MRLLGPGACMPGWTAARVAANRAPAHPALTLQAGGATYVLRKKPPGRILSSAHAVGGWVAQGSVQLLGGLVWQVACGGRQMGL